MASIPGEVTSRFEGEKVEYVVLVFDAKMIFESCAGWRQILAIIGGER